MAEKLNSGEVIAELRSIADAMGIRDIEPGFVSPSLKYRANDLLLRAGVPLGPWANHRQYLTKPGEAIINGSRVAIRVHKAVIDDLVGEICRAIVGCLNLVNWEIHPEYRDWSGDRAEVAIREAARRLPELCDKLQAIEGKSAPKQAGGGFTKKNLRDLTGYSNTRINQRLEKLGIQTPGGGRPSNKKDKPFSTDQVRSLLNSIVSDEGAQQHHKDKCLEAIKTLQ